MSAEPALPQIIVGPDRRAPVRVVYFLRAVGLGLIKIGVANCVHSRIRAIGRVCPVELEPLGVIETPGRSTLETQLHARFAHLRVRGEWFREGAELLDLIAAEAQAPKSARRLSLAERSRKNALRRAKREIARQRGTTS